MAATISPADRTLNLVISVSPLRQKPKHFDVYFGNEWSDRRFQLNIGSWSFTAARGRRRKRSQIPARARHAPSRHRRLKVNSRTEESCSTVCETRERNGRG
jgi:hypothetical protein